MGDGRSGERQVVDRRARIDESTIGETPVVELDPGWGLDAAPTVYAKVEWFNLHDQPYGGGSIKTRIARRMLDAAENEGAIGDRTVVEPTSGNTGVGLARVGGARGHDVIAVVPGHAAAGKVAAIREAGGTVEFVPAEGGYEQKLERVEEYVSTAPEDYYWPNQYDNPANPAAHEATTGPELWRQADGDLTHAVVGAGTGGTVTGVGRALHERGDVTVVGFEPNEDPHSIDGLRYFREKGYEHLGCYDTAVLDSRRYIDTETAWQAARELRDHYADRRIPIHDTGQYDESLIREKLRVDGEFLVGPSSGAAIALVRRLIGEGSLDSDDAVGILLCDRGDRYSESLWPHLDR